MKNYKGISRIIINVFDLEKSMELYTRLLGGTFYVQPAEVMEPYGCQCAVNIEAGIELLAPIPGRDSGVQRWIDKHGEGIEGVVWEVENLEEAALEAQQAGFRIIEQAKVDLSEADLERQFRGKLTKYREHFLHPTDVHNMKALFLEIGKK